MPEGKNREVRVRPVRKDKPDVRALARVLIELAIAESGVDQQKQELADDTATKESA
jgi:hypothetical protein